MPVRLHFLTILLAVLLAVLVLGSGLYAAAPATIGTLFVVAMENQNWSDVSGNSSAPYINGLLTQPSTSYATQYFNPPGVHPSEPNYIWLEAGSDFGLTTDGDPSPSNSIATPDHLVTQLDNAGRTWKAYQEDIRGTSCPLASQYPYAAKHNPMVFFRDVTGDNSLSSAYCIAHERPYADLATDIANNTVPNYAFITPNLCNDMHDSCSPTNNSVLQGDNWLSTEIPRIMGSQAYQQGGAIFIVWDEGEGRDGPIGMIALSTLAKGNGYHNSVPYTHSSLLRTVQAITGVSPLLGDAVNATDLSDLFVDGAIPNGTPVGTATGP